MTKQSKKQTSLNERDTLQDMLNLEKLVMHCYGAALIEGSSKPFRREIIKRYTEAAETQFAVFEQMLSRGYYKTQYADSETVKASAEQFAKLKKELLG